MFLEDGKSDELKNLANLEPYTDYICTGQIMDNNVNIKNTTAIKFRVDCGTWIITLPQGNDNKDNYGEEKFN